MFLILIDEKQYTFRRRAYYIGAGITALSSVASCFLTPLFYFRYLSQKERADLVIFAILVAVSAIQLYAILYSNISLGEAAYYHSSQTRLNLHADWLVVFKKIIFFTLQYPIGGYSRNLLSIVSAIILFALMVHVLYTRYEVYWLPIAAIWILTALSVIASLNMSGGERYVYASSLIVCIFLLGLACDKDYSKLLRLASTLLLVQAMIFWSVHYNAGMRGHYDSDWPVWANEVATWRGDPNYKLRIYPQLEINRERGIEWSIIIDNNSIK
jgi:hypothetical protein